MSPSPICRRPRPTSPSTTAPAWLPGQRTPGQLRPRASKWSSMPPVSTIPRLLRVAPNGDLFLAESETGKIRVFRGVTPDGKPQQTSVFAEGLRQPFGIAFYPLGPNPKYVYIGDTDGIVRFPYRKWRSESARSRQKTSPSCRAADAFAAAATGLATSSSRRTAASSSRRSARTPTWTTATRTQRSTIAPTCSSSLPTASS